MLATLGALSTQQLYRIGNHVGFLMRWGHISPILKKWSRNRDPDENRVAEIVACHRNGDYFPLHLHVAELQGEGLVCYDGNHRREALNRLGFPDMPVILDVLLEAKPYDVLEAFNNINKSVPVPAIYFEEKEDIAAVKEDILALVKSYEIRYKPFISTSPRYHAPHFNRDAFVENVTAIHQTLGISIQDIASLLERLNTEYSKGRLCRPHSLYKQPVLDKCRKHGLWIFLERQIPTEHIAILLKQKSE